METQTKKPLSFESWKKSEVYLSNKTDKNTETNEQRFDTTFQKQARYSGNGTYCFCGIFSTDISKLYQKGLKLVYDNYVDSFLRKS